MPPKLLDIEHVLSTFHVSGKSGIVHTPTHHAAAVSTDRKRWWVQVGDVVVSEPTLRNALKRERWGTGAKSYSLDSLPPDLRRLLDEKRVTLESVMAVASRMSIKHGEARVP